MDINESENDRTDTMSTMDTMDTMDTMESAEMQLEELEQHPEATQLQLLVYEIDHFHEHGIQPSTDWYEARFLKIYAYSELHWQDLANQFQHKNDYIYETATKISEMLAYLIEQWGASPIFDLSVYYQLVHSMNELWEHYSTTYVGDEKDEDIVDLIAGMTHL